MIFIDTRARARNDKTRELLSKKRASHPDPLIERYLLPCTKKRKKLKQKDKEVERESPPEG